VLILVFTIAFPWYYIHVNLKQVQDGQQCNLYKLYGWQKAYCLDNACPFPDDVLQAVGACKDDYNWRQTEPMTVNRGRVFTVSLVFSIISLSGAFLLTFNFFLNCCGALNHRIKNIIFGIIGFLGFMSLTIGIIYFPPAVIMAFKHDQVCANWEQLSTNQGGPCQKFIGSLGPRNVQDATYVASTSWGSVGYWGLLVAWLPYLIIMLLGFSWGMIGRRFKQPTSGLPNGVSVADLPKEWR